MDRKRGENNYDKMDLVERRIRYLLGARLRHKSRMKDAADLQDKIRSSHSQSPEWDSVTEIRKWRDRR